MLRRRLTEDGVGLVKCGAFVAQDLTDTCIEADMGAGWLDVLCGMGLGWVDGDGKAGIESSVIEAGVFWNCEDGVTSDLEEMRFDVRVAPGSIWRVEDEPDRGLFSCTYEY